MRHRLRPVRPRARTRLTLAALLLPLLAIVVLARVDAARRPLAEREAVLAVDLQRWRAERRHADVAQTVTAWTIPTMALVAGMPRVVGNRELQLRIAGMVAGALALGVLVRLGSRLFAPRVGIVAAVLLLALPSGRLLLGTELASEPFYLLAMLVSLLAMRGMAEARRAALIAGASAGIALAVAGVDAAWLPVLALAWLRVHQGLTLRSASVVLGATLGSAATALAIGWLAYGLGAGLPPLPSPEHGFGYLDATLLRPETAGRELLPLLPLVLLGLWTMRSAWWRSVGYRFVLLWVVCAGASWLALGSGAGLYVGVLLLAVSIGLLALEHARIVLSVPACGVALGLAFAVWSSTVRQSEGQALDRWAIREAGRFVGRVVDAERNIAASTRAARRFAFYGNRPVEPVATGAQPPAQTDYVILTRDDFQLLRGGDDEPRARVEMGKRRPKRIAEFGNWVVARLPSSAG